MQTLGEIPSLPLPSCWWLPAILGVPWLVDISLHSLLPSSHGVLYVCLSVAVSSYGLLFYFSISLNNF